MAEAARLFIARARRQPMCEVDVAQAVRDFGFGGCAHGKWGGRRQVLLVEEEALDDFGLAPGIVRENITTRGIPLVTMAPGQRLRIGEAVLEVSGPCEPCDRMDEIRMGLKEQSRGRRGILCRVVEGGGIRRGAAILVMQGAVAAHEIGGTH